MKPVREKLGRILLRRSEPQITYFDLEYMRRSVPIQRVAEQLGLRTAGNMIHSGGLKIISMATAPHL
jgi:hypothetical protein